MRSNALEKSVYIVSTCSLSSNVLCKILDNRARFNIVDRNGVMLLEIFEYI